MTNSALIQIHTELDEAAPVSGAGTGGVLRAVLLPLLAPDHAVRLDLDRAADLPRADPAGRAVDRPNNQPLSVLVWGYVQSSSYGKRLGRRADHAGLMVPFLFALLAGRAARRAIASPPAMRTRRERVR